VTAALVSFGQNITEREYSTTNLIGEINFCHFICDMNDGPYTLL